MTTPSPSMISNIGRASLGLLRGLVDSVRGFDKRTPEQKAATLAGRADALEATALALLKDAQTTEALGPLTPGIRRRVNRAKRRALRLRLKAGRLRARAKGLQA